MGTLCFMLLWLIAGRQVWCAHFFKSESKFGLDLTFDVGIQNGHVQWPMPEFLVPRKDVPQMLKSGDFDGVRSKHRMLAHVQTRLATQWVVES